MQNYMSSANALIPEIRQILPFLLIRKLLRGSTTKHDKLK